MPRGALSLIFPEKQFESSSHILLLNDISPWILKKDPCNARNWCTSDFVRSTAFAEYELLPSP